MGGDLWVFYGLPPGPAGCALPGESVGRKGVGYPQGISHPQSLPLGGRTVRGTVRSGPGEATINHRWAGKAGSDEGAIWYPTFSCRKREAPDCRLNRLFLLPRWATRSPPHQSPPVTASPQGEAFVGGVSPQRKAFSPNHCSRKMRIQIRARRWAPKQPLYRNNASPNPKTSECQRAGHKTGGPGGLPPALFLPISREKWGPPPGRRGPRGAAPQGCF